MCSRALRRDLGAGAGERQVPVGVPRVEYAAPDPRIVAHVPFLPAAPLGVDEDLIAIGVVIDPDRRELWPAVGEQRREVQKRGVLEHGVPLSWDQRHESS